MDSTPGGIFNTWKRFGPRAVRVLSGVTQNVVSEGYRVKLLYLEGVGLATY